MRPLSQTLAGHPDCGRKNTWVRLHRHRPVRANNGKISANWPGQPDRGPYEGTLARVFKDHGDDRASGIGYVEVVTHDCRKIWWRTRDCELVEDPGNPGTFFTFAATFGHELQQMPIVRFQGLYCNLTGGFLEVTEKYRGKMIRAVFRALDIDETEEFQNLPCVGEYERGDDECDPCQFRHVCSNVRNGVCVTSISSSIVDYADALIQPGFHAKSKRGRLSSKEPNLSGIPRTASTSPVGSLPGPGVMVTQDLLPTSGMAFTAPAEEKPRRTWIDVNHESIAATKSRGFPCWDGVQDSPRPPLRKENFPTPLDRDLVHQLGAHADYRQEQANAQHHYEADVRAREQYADSSAHFEARIKELQAELERRRRREAAEDDPINIADLNDWLSRPIGVPNGVPRKHKVEL